jgi:hypothetical protein
MRVLAGAFLAMLATGPTLAGPGGGIRSPRHALAQRCPGRLLAATH